MYEGRRPRRTSPRSVNCETTRSPPDDVEHRAVHLPRLVGEDAEVEDLVREVVGVRLGVARRRRRAARRGRGRSSPPPRRSTRTDASATRCTTARTAREDIIPAMGVPERIGRYQILGELGQGAMGTVYRGRDETLDRDVAVKVMSKGLADADARARFLREARAAARLQHPNIVVIYELGEHEGAPFMALELLEGVDLQRAIDGGIRPDPRATLPVVLQLLAGLGHAHEHGIVHRDVKPSNVFLPFGRPAKIMDFGVARLAGLGTTTDRGRGGHAELHVAGAGLGRRDRRPQRPLLGGPHPLRARDRREGVPGGQRSSRSSTRSSTSRRTSPSSRRGASGSGCARCSTRALARRPEDRYPDARAMSAELAPGALGPGRHGGLDGARGPGAPRAAEADAPAAPGRRAPAPVERARARAAPARVTPAPRRAPRGRASRAARGRLGAAALVALAADGRVALAAAGRGARRPDAASPRRRRRRPRPRRRRPPRRRWPTPAPARRPSPRRPRPPRHAGATPRRRRRPTPHPDGAAADAGAPAPGLSAEARLLRADDLVARGRWAEALAEARAVLEVQPRNARAAALAQQAEAELVIEECLRNARAALQDGDRERALEEVRRGFLVRKNDPRLLAMHREVVAAVSGGCRGRAFCATMPLRPEEPGGPSRPRRVVHGVRDR